MKTIYVNVKCDHFMGLKSLTPKTFMKETKHKGHVECVRYFKVCFFM